MLEEPGRGQRTPISARALAYIIAVTWPIISGCSGDRWSGCLQPVTCGTPLDPSLRLMPAGSNHSFSPHVSGGATYGGAWDDLREWTRTNSTWLFGGVRDCGWTERYLTANWPTGRAWFWSLDAAGTEDWSDCRTAVLRHLMVESRDEVETGYDAAGLGPGSGHRDHRASRVGREWLKLNSIVALTLPTHLASQG